MTVKVTLSPTLAGLWCDCCRERGRGGASLPSAFTRAFGMASWRAAGQLRATSCDAIDNYIWNGINSNLHVLCGPASSHFEIPLVQWPPTTMCRFFVGTRPAYLAKQL